MSLPQEQQKLTKQVIPENYLHTEPSNIHSKPSPISKYLHIIALYTLFKAHRILFGAFVMLHSVH